MRAGRGVTTFKLYMAYPETLQVDDDVILDILTMAKRRGGMVTIHAENGGAITALVQGRHQQPHDLLGQHLEHPGDPRGVAAAGVRAADGPSARRWRQTRNSTA